MHPNNLSLRGIRLGVAADGHKNQIGAKRFYEGGTRRELSLSRVPDF
jgi:hypothetical protein